MTLNGGTLKPPHLIKWMKLPNGRPPRMDLWGDNPFDARFPHLADDPIGRFRGFNDIDTLHAEIAREYRAATARCPKLWLSEWTIVSDRPLQLFSGFYVIAHGPGPAAERCLTRSPAARLTSPASAGSRCWTRRIGEGGAGWGLLDG